MTSIVLSESQDLLWLLKPAGLSVFPRHNAPETDCLLHRLLRERSEQKSDFPDRFEGGLLHRLDISTSGIVLAVKTPEALPRFRSLFTEKALLKTYRFISHRSVPWDSNQVSAAIAHDKRRKRRMVVQRSPSTPHRGKWYPAQTQFRRVGETLWEATMRSGVMHQIRVHAAFVGLPLAGDPIYGGGPLREAPEGVQFALHHARIEGPGLTPVTANLPEWWPA
ncbi:MAG: RNA pseudouridine synthase [Myxococcota bacterium]|nr:RNA pseudouridine synthase [Myxococcota bacterium]